MFMRKSSPHVLVSGPYGGFNLGDDAIAAVICDQFQSRGVGVVLAVGNVEGARRVFPGIPVVDRLNLRCGHFGSLRAIRECDCVVIGGGEQISEPRLPNPVWGLLATNLQLCCVARWFGKPCALLGVGVDKRLSVIGQYLMRRIFDKLDYISVRDNDSRQRLSRIIGKQSLITLGADPVFLFEPFSQSKARTWLAQKYGIHHDKPIVLVILSNDKFHGMDYLFRINIATLRLLKQGVRVLYTISDLQTTYDMRLFTDNMLYTATEATWLLPSNNSFHDLSQTIAAVNCVVSSRMHPLIFAAVHQTPFLCVARSAKMHALMSMIGSSDYLSINDFTEDDLFDGVMQRLRKGRETFFSPIHAQVSALQYRAQKQFDELCKVLLEKVKRNSKQR